MQTIADALRDELTIAEFNAQPEVPEPPEELRELLVDFPIDRANGVPPSSHPLWATWMAYRRKVTGKVGGRPRKPVVDAADVVEQALEHEAGELEQGETLEQAAERLAAAKLAQPYRAAAVAKIAELMNSKDERVAQRAAERILDMTDGRPAPAREQEDTGPTEIIYRTEAIRAGGFVPGLGLEDDA